MSLRFRYYAVVIGTAHVGIGRFAALALVALRCPKWDHVITLFSSFKFKKEKQ